MINEIITSLCLTLNDNPQTSKYYSSCINSMQAASIQYKIKPTVDNLEQKVNNEIRKETGEKVWFMAGVLYTLSQTGYMTYNIPKNIVADSITIQARKDTFNLTFNWGW